MEQLQLTSCLAAAYCHRRNRSPPIAHEMLPPAPRLVSSSAPVDPPLLELPRAMSASGQLEGTTLVPAAHPSCFAFVQAVLEGEYWASESLDNSGAIEPSPCAHLQMRPPKEMCNISWREPADQFDVICSQHELSQQYVSCVDPSSGSLAPTCPGHRYASSRAAKMCAV